MDLPEAICVRVPEGTKDRAAKLAKVLREKAKSSRMANAAVLRQALQLGLRQLEKDHSP